MTDTTSSRPATHATFSAMTEGTREDWAIIATANAAFCSGLPDRVMTHLRLLDGDFGGFNVDRLTHSLQTATRAHRAGRDDAYVLCALVHDIGDTLCSYSHPDVGAAIVKPFVDESYHWMVQQHGVFQGYYYFHHLGLDPNLRDRFDGHPYYDLTAEFCAEYDQPSFDPAYPTMPLEEFAPLLRGVLARPQRTTYRADASAAD